MFPFDGRLFIAPTCRTELHVARVSVAHEVQKHEPAARSKKYKQLIRMSNIRPILASSNIERFRRWKFLLKQICKVLNNWNPSDILALNTSYWSRIISNYSN